MPKVGGTRLYVFVAPSAARTGTGNHYDFLEVNVGQNTDGPYWINMDTTRVDRWGLPVAFRLQCGDGTLADQSFWSKSPASTFYQHTPANLYAAYWHEHAIGHLQYGFPYDDGQSSDVGCTQPQTLVIGVGF